MVGADQVQRHYHGLMEQSMIRKSVKPLSEKIMLKTKSQGA
jgi:hypothetical protein